MYYAIIIILGALLSSEVKCADEQQFDSTSLSPASALKPLLSSSNAIDELADQYYITTIKTLEADALSWYKYGNISEVTAQILGGATPVLVGLSAAIPPLSAAFTISAGISSTLAISSNNFAKYCHAESKQRSADLNSLLKERGYKPLPLMTASLTTDSSTLADGIASLSLQKDEGKSN